MLTCCSSKDVQAGDIFHKSFMMLTCNILLAGGRGRPLHICICAVSNNSVIFESFWCEIRTILFQIVYIYYVYFKWNRSRFYCFDFDYLIVVEIRGVVPLPLGDHKQYRLTSKKCADRALSTSYACCYKKIQYHGMYKVQPTHPNNSLIDVLFWKIVIKFFSLLTTGQCLDWREIINKIFQNFGTFWKKSTSKKWHCISVFSYCTSFVTCCLQGSYKLENFIYILLS